MAKLMKEWEMPYNKQKKLYEKKEGKIREIWAKKENYREPQAGNKQVKITRITKMRTTMMKTNINIKSIKTIRPKISYHNQLILGIRWEITSII